MEEEAWHGGRVGFEHHDEPLGAQQLLHRRVAEYFIYDRARERLEAYRLPMPEASRYERIAPEKGRYRSEALGLEFELAGGKLRLWAGNAPQSSTLAGSSTVKREPSPCTLSTRMWPPSWVTICCEIHSPSPSPP